MVAGQGKHEEILVEALDILREKGIQVIRLDCRAIPDAFAVVDGKVIAIEVETDGSPKYSRHSQFDEVITLTSGLKNNEARVRAYLIAIRLRKEGKTLRTIKNYLKDVGVHVGISTLHDWFRGKSLPRGLKITNVT
jgi:Holliday junction resolvase